MNHCPALLTEALTKSIINDNVFISVKSGSIEAQVFRVAVLHSGEAESCRSSDYRGEFMATNP